jgi:error-prone DNA polymerase
LRGHPLQFVRAKLDRMGIVPSQQLATLPVDRRYKVAGLVLLRQRPGTAKGITFVTIEDETGPANLIIRQEVWERYRRVAGGATAMIAHGRLQRVDAVIHLLVDRMQDLGRLLGQIDSRSRDFH